MILEYKLEKYPEGMMTPAWVEDGGYFYNPTTFTFVGWSPDVREYKIPDSVLVLTRNDLVTRVSSLGYTKEDSDGTTVPMTTLEIQDMVDEFINSRG